MMRTTKRMDQFQRWGYIIPVLAFYAIFLFYPFVSVIYMSFQGGIGKMSFAGLANYKRLFGDATVLEILKNTAIWVVGGTIIKIGFGLLLALYLNREFPGKKVLMLIILLPWATPYIISAVAWRWMYNPLYGYLNDLLMRLGVLKDPIAFLGSTSTSLVSAMFAHAWTGIPFCALSFLSVLYSIPETLFEAAAVDGAGRFRIFFKITLPIIMPSLLMLTVLVSIWGFNAFGVIWTMTQGGPLHSSEILITYIYRVYFSFLQYGFGSAVAVVSFLLLLAMSSLYIWSTRRASID